MGQGLRFVQEYFLVACSLADLVRRFRRRNADWNALPDKVAIQLNDTHPAMAVPELMRILLDDAHLPWDQAWDLTRRTLAYTNHTLLPEALEKWPLDWFAILLPRHLEIILEINRRFLDDVRRRFPGDEGRVERVSLIEEGAERKVRMANLAIVGSHSTNGVAAIHSELLRTTTVRDLAELFPERFNNKTNGVTPRRWLLLANPALAGAITDAIGDGWVTDLAELRRLAPLADDAGFRDAFRRAKRDAKVRFADWLRSTTGQAVDPDTIFDCQVKRIHEYKRQLLNALRIVVLYDRLRENPGLDMSPRTFFFAGKAAPAYHLAKVIIKFLNNLAATIDGGSRGAGPAQGRLPARLLRHARRAPHPGERRVEPDLDGRLRGERHEQHEVHDERRAHASARATARRSRWPRRRARRTSSCSASPPSRWPRAAAGTARGGTTSTSRRRAPRSTSIFSDHFSRNEPGAFEPLREALLTHGDYYMHLADLRAYLRGERAARRALRATATAGRGRRSSTWRRPASSRATGRSPSTPPGSGTRSPAS